MTRILFPYDGSPSAQHALDWLLRWAQVPAPLEIRVLNVPTSPFIPPEPMIGDLLAASEGALMEQGRQLLEPVAARLSQAGIAHTIAVVIGSPATVIARQVLDHQCDHVVMGTRGLGSVKGLVVGSTATKVVHLSPVPVTLVK